jgi:hypothetical protein
VEQPHGMLLLPSCNWTMAAATARGRTRWHVLQCLLLRLLQATCCPQMQLQQLLGGLQGAAACRPWQWCVLGMAAARGCSHCLRLPACTKGSEPSTPTPAAAALLPVV